MHNKRALSTPKNVADKIKNTEIFRSVEKGVIDKEKFNKIVNETQGAINLLKPEKMGENLDDGLKSSIKCGLCSKTFSDSLQPMGIFRQLSLSSE